jgi:iron complex outermembrane receptor protein
VSYTLFNLGTAYNFRAYGYENTLRFNLDNVSNKKYWRDVEASSAMIIYF